MISALWPFDIGQNWSLLHLQNVIISSLGQYQHLRKGSLKSVHKCYIGNINIHATENMQKKTMSSTMTSFRRLFEQPIASFLIEGSATLLFTVQNAPAEILSAGKMSFICGNIWITSLSAWIILSRTSMRSQQMKWSISLSESSYRSSFGWFVVNFWASASRRSSSPEQPPPDTNFSKSGTTVANKS